ncbi:hypothetical protein EWM64_g2048 [Hericium alpestre]|uniref:Uncharacterized protein n=1 Tax=Hericium alpestre TaxID=135208 RepID=A0A4Z0A8Q0_9AGAM|nr:hypothetical protein EWM64_g2048 [Hericium alpestre]
MSANPSPLNAAHQHAANADDYIAQGLLIPASEEHEKASQAFQACVDASTDENVGSFLTSGKELERRISSLREQGIDPSLPQKPTIPRPPSVPSRLASGHSPSPPPNGRARMGDSQHTVDESFMLLGQQSADAGDPFNHFWRALETLDHLSQAVAFATAPLSPDASQRRVKQDGSTGSDTDIEDNSRSKRALGRGRSKLGSPDASFATAYDGDGAKDLGKSVRMKQSKRPAVDAGDGFDEIAEEDYDSSDSFCLIPSKTEPSASTLKSENASLRSEVESMQKQLEAAELMLKLRKDQDQQLRDNIAVARREAQRAMGASLVAQNQPARPGQSTFDLSSLNLNLMPAPSPLVPINPGPGRDREAQLVRRVRELEEEKAMISKFRERWDKLKESAKRKREAKAAAEAQNAPVHERIDEEPEAEAEQDEQQA